MWNGGCAGFFYGYGIPDCTISAEKDFDDGVKKITRYQQYFGIKNTLARLNTKTNNKYTGGVIWHTQGSGKSLTMVMLAQLIAAHPNIKNPKIISVLPIVFRAFMSAICCV